jgi:hypothetical protein
MRTLYVQFEIMDKRLLEGEQCPEKWDSMQLVQGGALCATCSVFLEDLSDKPMAEVVQHLGKNKCVKLADYQIQLLNHYRKMGKMMAAASLVAGMAFANPSLAQGDMDGTGNCVVQGKVMLKGRPVLYRKVVLTTTDSTYETTTDGDGRFVISLPRNSSVTHTNLGLNCDRITKQVGRKDELDLKRVDVKFDVWTTRMGFL